MMVDRELHQDGRRTSAWLGRAVRHLLQGGAAICLLLLGRKAWSDVDFLGFDPLLYHLPFAARLWHITTAREFGFLDYLEYVYQGFPHLAEFLQGFLWRATGHMQATNLVALSSLLLYCLVAWRYLRIPGYLLFLALLATPLIQIHATSSFVDLPANVGCAIALLLVYRFYATTTRPTWREVGGFVLAAGAAANMKLQLAPVVGLASLAALGRLLWYYRAGEAEERDRSGRMPALLLASLPLVFVTYLKNAVVYGNPFYPIPFSLFGIDLPYRWDAYLKSPDYLDGAPESVRWLLSIFEIRAFDARRPYLWTGDQGFLPDGAPGDRMGGYFFAFVLLNVLLFGFLVWRSCTREARVGGLFFLVVSLITSALPQSHLLRYYMYWVIVLITLNWYLLLRAQGQRWLRVTTEQFGLVCCLFLSIVVGLTGGTYFRTMTNPTLDGYTEAIEPSIEDAIEENPALCLVGATNLAYLYADTFHAPLHYTVKAALDEEECGSRFVMEPLQ
jgi:hypothetical protein